MTDSTLLMWLLLAAIIAIIVLWNRSNQLHEDLTLLQANINGQVQEELTSWKGRELQSVREQLGLTAKTEAGLALNQWRMEAEAEIRADAIKRSAAVVSGKVTEHLAPYMGVFPYNPKDVRFLGTPVDLIIFDGMNEEALRQIIFLEIKTASSSLTTRERRIRDLVQAKKVTWQEFRVG